MPDMMDPATAVTAEEYKLFYSIDREMYTVLVMHLRRDPLECMQVMGFWLWLERMGYGDIVKKMLSLPFILINELVDEAITCIDCITSSNPASHSPANDPIDIPLIQSLLNRDITLQHFAEDRAKKSEALAKVVNGVCTKSLSDILHQALQRNITQKLLDYATFQPSCIHPEFAPIGYGLKNSISTQSEIPADNRTMFVTFSKGYPVLEREVKDFFSLAYGECIEGLYMQEVKGGNEQSLYAKIVFNSPSIIDMILHGAEKAKFTINGKHVWARKFVPKRPKTLMASKLLPPPTPLLHKQPSNGF